MTRARRTPLNGLGIGLATLSAFMAAFVAAVSTADARTVASARSGPAPASAAARQVTDWVIASGDDHGLPFIIVDKVTAEVFVFQADGRLVESTPALLGQARGDDSAPGIGERKLSAILPAERTTPAGRFVASVGNDLGEKNILWVDYASAISLHRVITTNPKERRLQRLATATPLDNRISYGCINVPAEFFDRVVLSVFSGKGGIVYVLPEVRSLSSAIPGYEAR